MKNTLLCVLAAVCLLTGCAANKTQQPETNTQMSAEKTAAAKVLDTPASESVFAMDTYMTVTAYSGNGSKAVNESIAAIKELESLWSVNDKTSDIYRVNTSSAAVKVDSETAELLSFALEMYRDTNGVLDITLYPVLREWGFTTGNYTVPSADIISEKLKHVGADKVRLNNNTVSTPEGVMVDFGSVAKGKTGDRIAEIMRENGVDSALMDLGGNIQAVGRKTNGNKWKVGLKNPYSEDYFAVLEIEDCAVITSGGYERYFEQDGETYWHILDPKTGRPAKNGLISVTIIGKKGLLCDALSTALFVMGENSAVNYWRTHKDFEFVMVTADNRVLVSEGIEDSFTAKGFFEKIEVIDCEG